MKRTHLFLAVLAFAAALAFLPACQTSEVTGPTDSELYTRDQVPDINDPYGGYNLADEPPGFGDPALLEESSEAKGMDYDDPISDTPAVARLIDRPVPRHFLLITWGNLERDSTITFATDWSGSLTVDAGTIILRRVIRFEPRDRILPRERRDLLEWISYTGPAFDGILVRILPAPTAASVESVDSPGDLTFSTGPLTISFTYDELKDIHKVIRVDEAGNAVAFNSIIVPRRCPHGFLGGVWRNDPDENGGIFYGMWMSELGHHVGYLKGFYGVDSTGARTFFGKWIDCNGRFKGILRGHWGSFPNAPGGFFEGVWFGRSLRVQGTLKGIWKHNNAIDRGGFFRGRWATRCP